MTEPLRLRTALEPRGPAAAIVLDDEQVAHVAGAAKVAPVRVTVNGRTLRLRLARMRGESLIGFSRAARAEAGVAAGEEHEFEIALDDAPREVDVPPELAAALDGEAGARSAFDALAYTQRKEMARSVAEAKKPETRERRIAAVLRTLRG
jgi:hypothetical protein